MVEKAYAHLFAGEVQEFLSCLAEDCILIEAESLPYGGSHVGREVIQKTLTKILETWSEFSFDIEDIIANDDVAIAYGSMKVRGRSTGVATSFALAERWHVDGGLVSKIVAIYGDTALANFSAGS